MSTILRNSVRCLACGTEVESKHRHDFVTCPCGNVSVDGGHAYLKRCFPSHADGPYFEDTSVVEEEVGA